MSIPIYQDAQRPEELSKEAHYGLWFERFFDQYDAQNQWKILEPEAKQEKQGKAWWLKNYFNKKVGDDEQLSHYAHQLGALIENYEGKAQVFSAQWHFVTGMGNPHPVENGFAWHPTLGVPYLSGAAVKGLVRSYIEQNLDDTESNKQALLLKWFGSERKFASSDNNQTGALVFFDAVPIESVLLGVDIMTPHMGEWYAKGGEATEVGKPETVPADWHSPNPIPFLAAKAIALQFGFALRAGVSEQDKNSIDLDDVADVLKRVLEQQGAGGKTATGYGAMARNTNAEQKHQDEKKALKEQALTAQMSEQQRQIDALRTQLEADKSYDTKGGGSKVVNDLAILLQAAGSWDLEDRKDLADLAESIYDWHGWGPKKKRPSKQQKLAELRS